MRIVFSLQTVNDFSLNAFKTLSLVSEVWLLWVMPWISLDLSFWCCHLFESVGLCLLINWEYFQHYFFEYIVNPTQFLLTLWKTQNTNLRSFVLITYSSLRDLRMLPCTCMYIHFLSLSLQSCFGYTILPLWSSVSSYINWEYVIIIIMRTKWPWVLNNAWWMNGWMNKWASRWTGLCDHCKVKVNTLFSQTSWSLFSFHP